MTTVPIIDIGALGTDGDITDLARAIDRASREVGFFSIVNHGVDPARCQRVERLARDFFSRPESEKQRVAMVHAGAAWRGWFPLGGELTAGTPDRKEGYYFGRELSEDDPRVRSALPLHGPNLWPTVPGGLRSAVLEYLGDLESLGQRLTRAISVALGLGADGLAQRWFRDPTVLLRIFRYPPSEPAADHSGASTDATPDTARGVGEHTDYGFLTLLWQDDRGGLEVRTNDGWVDVPPDRDAFVCNIGDMLDRLTGGRYRSTPHRVRSPDTDDRIAIPFFFDPDWDARIDALPLAGEPPGDDASMRWDRRSVHGFDGSYGDYLMTKVVPVFPNLGTAVLPTRPTS